MRARTPSLLSRELTDVPDTVRAAPAPACPTFDPPFAIRPVDPAGDDPFLIAEWMRMPHLVETWERPWSPEQWRTHCDAQWAGTYSRPYILGYDFAAIDQPDVGYREIAYIELYRAAKDEISRLYPAEPLDLGFHIATADTGLIGRGIMSGWIGLLPAALWAVESECRRLLCDPDHRNTRMRRALVKNGWSELGEFDVRPDRRIALHSLEHRHRA